jgi:ABC-type multidrug transport system ATPase subunit
MAAYLPQKITFKDEELTVLDCFREDIFLPEGKAREYLSKFMFYGNTIFKKVRHLSGGERIRLKLGRLLYEDVNLLILDEPTNHLDIDSIETFEEALEEFKALNRVTSIESDIKEIDLSMKESRLHYEELNKLFCRKEELSKELNGVMEVWLSFNN